MDSFDAELDANRAAMAKALEQLDQNIATLRNDIAELGVMNNALAIKRQEENINRQHVIEFTKAQHEILELGRLADLGDLEWAERPLEPQNRTFPKLSTTMSGAIAIGLFLSLGIAFLREVTDTTVRSPRDIVRVGQMNLLGMVSHEADDPQSSGARLPLVIFEAPQSLIAEQLRQVRTRLQHAASLDTTRSILVTSPSPGDGKSTIAVNLAAGLALNGRRILLVDANFRRPELHRIFGVANETLYPASPSASARS